MYALHIELSAWNHSSYIINNKEKGHEKPRKNLIGLGNLQLQDKW